MNEENQKYSNINSHKKILVINDFFNYYNIKHSPSILKRFYNYFMGIKLRSFINNLQKKYHKNLDIRIITANKEKLHVNNEINLELLSDIRISLRRSDFLSISNELIKNTKDCIEKLHKNGKIYENFYFNYTFLPSLLEFNFKNIINQFFGEIGLLKHIINKDTYEDIIFFNCNQYAIDFFRSLKLKNRNILIYNNKALSFILNKIGFLNLIFLYLKRYGKFLKEKIFNKSFDISKKAKLKKNFILFIANTKNQFNSIYPVYKVVKKRSPLEAGFYSSEPYIPLLKILKLLKFLIHKRAFLKSTSLYLSKNMIYDSIHYKNLFKIIYKSIFYEKFIDMFDILNNLQNKIKKKPSLVVIANDFNPASRLTASYFKSKKIPTLYIPHAAIPIIEEFYSLSDIDYYALGGKFDKEYYAKKGVAEENIIVTGTPRYDHAFFDKVDRLNEIQDTFNGKRYSFSQNKPPILLTTNPIDDISNEKIITTVINAIKKLKITNKLIIKLHPREDGKIQRRVVRHLNFDTFIVKDYDILELINSCVLLISQKSTTLLEAIILGKPIILLDFINKSFNETSKYAFLDNEYIIKAQNEGEFTNELKKLIFNDKIRENYKTSLKNLSKNILYFDPEEDSTQKILNLILEII